MVYRGIYFDEHCLCDWKDELELELFDLSVIVQRKVARRTKPTLPGVNPFRTGGDRADLLRYSDFQTPHRNSDNENMLRLLDFSFALQLDSII